VENSEIVESSGKQWDSGKQWKIVR